MKSALTAALVAALACAAVPVSARDTYGARFTLDALPTFDGPGGPSGAWLPNRATRAELSAREWLRDDTHPGQPPVEPPVWGPTVQASPFQAPEGDPLSFGHALAFLLPNSWLMQTEGHVDIGPRHLSVQATTVPLAAEAWGQSSWSRGFRLDAGASITFAGRAGLRIDGTAPPLDAMGSLAGGDGASFASLRYGDRDGRVAVSIGATLTNLADGLTGVFDSTIAPDGHLSLTITNPGAEALFGRLDAGAFLRTTGGLFAAPVPEPHAWLLLLVGAALVTGRARRYAAAPR